MRWVARGARSVAIVGAVTAFFTVFADLGLSPAIIQKSGKLTKYDISTALSIQLILGILIIAVIFLASNLISGFYHLGVSGVVLLRLYSLIFIISPFRQIPSAILERSLKYRKLAIAEILGLTFGSSSSVFLAFEGFGVYSLVFGQIIGQAVAALVYWRLSAWPVGFSIRFANLVSMSRFGLPFQTNQIFGLFYGPLILLYLGKQVGAQNLGFFHFAAGRAVALLQLGDPRGGACGGRRDMFADEAVSRFFLAGGRGADVRDQRRALHPGADGSR